MTPTQDPKAVVTTKPIKVDPTPKTDTGVDETLERWKSDIKYGFTPKCSYCGIKSRKVVGQTVKGQDAELNNNLPRNWGYYCKRCYDDGMKMEKEAMYGN